jgi:hypothetical protein
VNYDELSGVELAVAVAERQGWRLFKATDPRGMDVWVNDIKGGFEFKSSAYHYRPDQRIEQAWELGGEGWLWRTQERYREPTLRVIAWNPKVLGDDAWGWFGASVSLADFESRAHAHATAICRAYLKATDPEVAR